MKDNFPDTEPVFVKERAQPVEGPREQVLAVYPDAFAKHECGVVQGIPYSYWEIWVTPKDKWSSKTAGSGVTESLAWKNASYRLPAAPVEGVERVTDDAPARVEPRDTCPMCEFEQKPCPGGAHAFALWKDGIRTVEDYAKMVAAQPAKHTDDRPAETIPDLRSIKEWLYPQLCRFNKESHCSHFRDILAGSYKRYEQINSRGLDVALVDESIVNGMTFQRVCQLIQSFHSERAETRIEVLEAALRLARKDVEYKRDHSQTAQGRKNAARTIEALDAALDAPTGDTTKEKV